MLRFLVQAPHGYHVEMASQTSFVYGDEDTVMACLTKVHTLYTVLSHSYYILNKISLFSLVSDECIVVGVVA